MRYIIKCGNFILSAQKILRYNLTRKKETIAKRQKKKKEYIKI